MKSLQSFLEDAIATPLGTMGLGNPCDASAIDCNNPAMQKIGEFAPLIRNKAAKTKKEKRKASKTDRTLLQKIGQPDLPE